MKFSQIAKGKRAEKPHIFTFGQQLVGGVMVPIQHEVLVAPLSAIEEMDVEADAIREAKRRGAEPVAGNSVFESARMMAVIHAAILDKDSPPGAREPYFALGLTEIGTLDPDTIAHLHQVQQAWQEEISPSYRHKNGADLFKLVKEVADSDDPLVFARYSLKTQWSLGPFMAKLLRPSLTSSSSSGSSSEADSPRSERAESPPSSPTASSISLTETTTARSEP